MKKCSKCKENKNDSDFYLKNGKLRHQCKECHKREIRNLQQEKRKLINSYKTECEICGFKKYKSALHFHHPNDDKSYEPSRLNRNSIKIIKKELKKCIVLCANCHSALHNNEL